MPNSQRPFYPDLLLRINLTFKLTHQATLAPEGPCQTRYFKPLNALIGAVLIKLFPIYEDWDLATEIGLVTAHLCSIAPNMQMTR